MTEDKTNSQPLENQGVEKNENPENLNDDRFESDTQKIVRRHLEDKDDIITDKDIAGVRVGMVPPEFDKATEARFEDEEAREESEEELTRGTKDMKKHENLEGGQMTPWDIIDPTK